MAAAACSRGNLQLLFVDKRAAGRLARVEAMIASRPPTTSAAAAADDEQPPQPPPSVLRGLVVRLKYAGTYHLLPVEQLFAAADGKPGLAVASPDPQQQHGAPLRVQLNSASGTNPLADDQWDAAGRAEVEQLAALLQQRGQPLSVAEVAAAAWRKQAALAWHAQHGALPPSEQQQHLPELLQQLADEEAIAELQQQVEPEPGQQQQAQPASFTVQLQRPAHARHAQPPGQAQAGGVQQQQQQQRQQRMALQPPQQQQHVQHAVNAVTAAQPASTAASPPAAAAADFLAGLEQQLAHATARSAADGSSDATAAVVADIQQQLLALKQQLLAQQQQQAVAAVQPAWHASSSSGDHLSPYAGPAMHGGQLHPSPPLPAWQLQQQAGLPHGPLHQPLPADPSPRQGWYGESGSPPRHHINAGSMGLGGRPGRLPSRSPSPRRREWRGPVGEPPLVPAAVCHFKFGNTIRWELVGREVFVSGLPTCDGERMERRVVAHRLANLIEGTGAAVEGVKINSGDARGDLAYVTLGSARQAARAIELLQGAELMDKQLFFRPFRNEVDGLKQRFPEAAAEAAKALEDLAAQGPPWGPGPPPFLRGPPPPPMRGQSPPPHTRGGSPPRFRSRSPRRFRSRSPPHERGRKRGRSGDRSLSPGRGGRRAARSVSPDAILAPVLVNHFLQREGQQEWLLTGRQVEISGLRDSGDEAAMWQQIMPLVGAAGGTVTDRRVAGGDDSRGPLMFLTLATAQQAAAVIECLQAVEVEGGQLYLRPVRQEVEDKSRRHPEAAAAARRALKAASGRSGGSGPPGGSSPGGSRRDRGEAPRRERSPARRRSPGPAGQPPSKGGGRGGGHSKAAKPSSSGGGSSAFWDPVYRLERRCLALLQSQGPTTVSWLFGELGAVPPPCGPLNTTLLRHFLDRRPHLFRLDRGEQVEAAEGAAAVLRYKRELLQYLGSRPPQGRVTAEQLDSQMAPPSGLPSHLASKGAVHFVREILWREAEVVTVEPSVVAVELRPFLLEADECLAARNAGYQLPTFSQPCRFFFQLNGTRASCTHGLRCRFVHARERADFT